MGEGFESHQTNQTIELLGGEPQHVRSLNRVMLTGSESTSVRLKLSQMTWIPEVAILHWRGNGFGLGKNGNDIRLLTEKPCFSASDFVDYLACVHRVVVR